VLSFVYPSGCEGSPIRIWFQDYYDESITEVVDLTPDEFAELKEAVNRFEGVG
jgi:hypothetical protein